jgi:uncharacterized protein YqeY
MDISSHDIVGQLRTDLLEARKARDSLTSAALQAVVAAIDNAGAVSVPESLDSIGVGSTEASRRELSARDIQEIIKREITEMKDVITQLGHTESSYVDELNNKVAILERYV